MLVSILCGLFMLATCALSFRGMVALVHDAARWSNTALGKKWWFWLGLVFGTLLCMAIAMYHLIHGFMWFLWALER